MTHAWSPSLLVFLLMGMAVSGSLLGAAQTDVIVGEVVWTGEVTVRDVVTIPAGQTLIIRDATVQMDLPGPISGCTDWQLYPHQCVEGFDIKGGTLILERSHLFPVAAGRMWHITQNGGHLEMRDSIIEHGHIRAVSPGDMRSPSIIDNTSWSGSGGIGAMEGTPYLIQDSEFLDLGVALFMVDAKVSLQDNRFHNASVKLLSSVTRDKDGTSLLRAWYDARGNQFDAGSRLEHQPNAGSVIADNTFFSDSGPLVLVAPMGGESLDQDRPVVTGNRFLGLNISIYVVAREWKEGVDHQMPLVQVIRHNTILAGCRGIVFRDNGLPVEVDARDNWWGSPDGPWQNNSAPRWGDQTCTGTVGPVDVDRWLRFDPAVAPPEPAEPIVIEIPAAAPTAVQSEERPQTSTRLPAAGPLAATGITLAVLLAASVLLAVRQAPRRR